MTPGLDNGLHRARGVIKPRERGVRDGGERYERSAKLDGNRARDADCTPRISICLPRPRKPDDSEIRIGLLIHYQRSITICVYACVRVRALARGRETERQKKRREEAWRRGE